MPNRAVVQVAGDAFRMNARTVLQEFRRAGRSSDRSFSICRRCLPRPARRRSAIGCIQSKSACVAGSCFVTTG